MITVTISINGSPIFTRSAVRREQRAQGKTCTYDVDDGSVIEHPPISGAVSLAIKMLATIREQPHD